LTAVWSVDIKNVKSLFPSPNVLVVVSKGMRAATICFNRSFHFLTAGAG